ncbi:MAG: glycoside hydrolase family 16 protein [Candidatus Nomurabacteria bacterium]|nr:MAG: glycoside hydrolase family 16 protein [Candidatus Nomurabacteria bacterium]
MDRLLPAVSQRPFRKVSNARMRRRKLKVKKTLANTGVFVIMVTICSLLFAYPYIIRTLIKEKMPNVVASVDSNLSTPAQYNPLFATKPSWFQNFANKTSGFPDPKYWNVLVGPAENSNNEQQYYTDSFANLRIENGTLRLIASHDSQPSGYQYGSARLETQGKQSFLYGRIDITAKLPSGVGTWPAIWLLPANDKYAKRSPINNTARYKNGGEIDIVEAVGFKPDIIYGVVHTASDANRHPDGTGSFGTIKVPDDSASFNLYSLLWTPTSVTFAVNNTPYYTYTRTKKADYTTWPFDQPFYLIVNLAMGGTWGGMDTAHYPGNGIDNSALPASLDIGSIYYYPYVGS